MTGVSSAAVASAQRDAEAAATVRRVLRAAEEQARMQAAKRQVHQAKAKSRRNLSTVAPAPMRHNGIP